VVKLRFNFDSSKLFYLNILIITFFGPHQPLSKEDNSNNCKAATISTTMIMRSSKSSPHPWQWIFKRRIIWILSWFGATLFLFHSVVYDPITIDSGTQSILGPSDMLLLGILVTAGDHHYIDDWLQRHINLFETLVVIDGSPLDDYYVQETCKKYPTVKFLKETELNITAVTDQTVRAPAMKYFGDNPIGRWILICHADEYWTVDPRTIIQATKNVNIIRFPVMTASPMESEYLQTIEKWKNRTDYWNFDIRQVSKWAAHPDSKVERNRETRIFQWVHGGMKWGTKHSKVTPEFHPKPIEKTVSASPYVHYKMSDFSPKAVKKWNGESIDTNKTGIPVSNDTAALIVGRNPGRLRTGLHKALEGWRGAFLDLSDPKGYEKLPPHRIEKEIETQWKIFLKLDIFRNYCKCANGEVDKKLPLPYQYCCLLPLDRQYYFPSSRSDNAGMEYMSRKKSVDFHE
jgi:hypothetical protein